MKKSIYSILYAVFLIGIVFFSACDEGEEGAEKQQTLDITSDLVNSPTCKSGLKSSGTEDTSDSLSCVEYYFDEANNKLTLKHINAGFNCCPENIYVQTSLSGDTIIIEEHEVDGMCDCDCLYDLEIELEGIAAKKYQIEFNEPYASPGEISFEVDLTNTAEGEFCVTRKFYPWGVNDTEQLELSGELVGNSDCKSELKSASTTTSDSLSCVEYSFDEANHKLNLTHINAGFNCCPGDLNVQASLSGDTIIVEEFESSASCHCNCLYDLDIEVGGVVAKSYLIKFIEPYADGDEILFEVNFAGNNSGEFCITRKYYPWAVIDNEQAELSGKLISNSNCKSGLKSSTVGTDVADSLSCVEYSFDKANHKLNLTHINAAFNCCPEDLYVQASLNGNTIVVEESEKSAACSCNCLYDLEIELSGVGAENYTIKFIEPYANESEIIFEVDLANTSEGEFCVTRKEYPWSMASTY